MSVASAISENRYSLQGPLTPGAHTWQVVAAGECGETRGELWSFCLLDAPSAPVSPIDGQSLPVFPAALEWEPVCGATTYTVFLNNIEVAVTTEPLAAVPPALAAPGNHSWHVLTHGECAIVTEGPVWTFSVACPAPGAASAPSPLNEETVGCGLELLSWEDAPGAASYLVMIDGQETAVTSSSEYMLTDSLGPGPHEWQVVAVNQCGETTGPSWTFCVLDTPVPVTPASDETTHKWSRQCHCSLRQQRLRRRSFQHHWRKVASVSLRC